MPKIAVNGIELYYELHGPEDGEVLAHTRSNKKRRMDLEEKSCSSQTETTKDP
jgi:hypothetical protein